MVMVAPVPQGQLQRDRGYNMKGDFRNGLGDNVLQGIISNFIGLKSLKMWNLKFKHFK